MKKIIVTYFEPFNHRDINASQSVALSLRDDIKKIGLRVSWKDIDKSIQDILALNPIYLFLIGESGKINTPQLELEAHNISNGKDNDGIEKHNEKIIIDEDDTLYTNFKNIDNKFIQSRDAGKYLCNHSYYLALHKTKNTKVIFIHVPAFNKEDIETKQKTIEIVNDMINTLILNN